LARNLCRSDPGCKYPSRRSSNHRLVALCPRRDRRIILLQPRAIFCGSRCVVRVSGFCEVKPTLQMSCIVDRQASCQALWISSRTACAVHNAKGNCIWSGNLSGSALDAPRFNLCQNKLIAARGPVSFLVPDVPWAGMPTPTADRPAMNPTASAPPCASRPSQQKTARTRRVPVSFDPVCGRRQLHQRRL